MLAPFRIASYRFQWGADLAASWAIEMEQIVLAWFVLVETDSVLFLTIFASLPYIGTLLAPYIGSIGDRIGNRRMLGLMRAIYLGLAAMLLALSMAGSLGPTQAFVIAALAGIVRPSDLGLRNVLTGEIMPPGLLMGAIGLTRITMDTARIAGALTGVSLIAMFGMTSAFAAIVALYAASVTLTALGGRFAPARAVAPKPAETAAPGRSSIADAVALVWRIPAQRAAMSIGIMINLTTYPFMMGLLPYVAREVYGVGQAGLGYLVASTALGCLTGALLVGRIAHRILPGRFMILAAMGWQFATLALGATTGLAGGMAVIFLAGFAQGLCIVPAAVIQLRNAPPEMRGRISGLRTLVVYGLPMGLALAGVLIDRIGFSATTSLYGGVGLAASIAMLIGWRRHLWPADAPANRRD